MTEDAFRDAVMDLATRTGWRCFHPLRATVRGRWLTVFKGHRGYVDLTLARDGHVLHVELKDDKGKYGPGQVEWAAAIGDSHRLWRPSDLRDGTIQKELKR